MAENKRRRAGSPPVWGILLVFVGTILLLQTLDVLPWGLWGTLWRFWPVLIIIVGVGILLRRYNVWLVSLLVLAILGACLGIAIWQQGTFPLSEITTRSYSKSLGNLEYIQIEMDFTAGSAIIDSLPSSSANLIEADFTVKNGQESMKVTFQREDNQGKLSLNTEQHNQQIWRETGIKWTVNLTRNIPLTINVRSAASNLNFDLDKLKVVELRLDIDAGNCQVTMPSSAGITRAYIEVDATNLEVIIPKGVAAKIWADADLTAFYVDTSRFSKRGDYYISQDFESAENQVEIVIDCDVSRVQVK